MSTNHHNDCDRNHNADDPCVQYVGHRQEHHHMGDNTADLDDLNVVLYNAANDYRYDTSDKHAAAVDDACAAWLRARGIGIHRPYVESDDPPAHVESDDPPAHVDDRAEPDRLDRLRDDFIDKLANEHHTAVQYGGHTLNRSLDDAATALRDALIAWDDTHPDPAGDEVTG